MAGQYTRLQKPYKIMDADGVGLYRGVEMTGVDECKKPTADNAIPLGVVDNDERLDTAFQASGDQTGRQVSVKLEGIALIELAETVNVGDRIILAAGGFAKAATTLTAGTAANVLGFAEQNGVAGDVIPVRMQYHVVTI